MKIKMKAPGYPPLYLLLPTRMIFSATAARLFNRVGIRYAEEDFPTISPETMTAIAREIQAANKRMGKWYLLDAESAEGYKLTIRL